MDEIGCLGYGDSKICLNMNPPMLKMGIEWY